MKKLKPWQIALLIIFYPAGIMYLIWKYVLKKNTPSLNNGTFDKEKYDRQNQKVISDFYRKFDLSSSSGIQNISVDDYRVWSRKAVGVPSLPEQILRKQATKYKNEKNWELAIECLRKSNELMRYSECSYSKDEYERLVNYLILAKRFDEAKKEQEHINNMFSCGRNPREKNEGLNRLQMQIKLAKEIGTDLLEMSEHPCTCGECAKYQGRVFSISGKNKNFPKLPEHFIKIGGVHEGCRHDFYPYFEDMPPAYHKDIVKYSNRPFVDNRTKAQKEMYEKEMRKIEDEEKDRENYNWCYENLEDLCPKSFSGYRRMKNSNSANFKKLCAAAAEKGRSIS